MREGSFISSNISCVLLFGLHLRPYFLNNLPRILCAKQAIIGCVQHSKSTFWFGDCDFAEFTKEISEVIFERWVSAGCGT